VPTWLDGSFRRITVPELPRRVVAFIRRRRPSSSAPTLAALETLIAVTQEQGAKQHGVYPDAAALPFARTR
jgi:LysR family hydrogen peroxide-inducible transcriptional activator